MYCFDYVIGSSFLLSKVNYFAMESFDALLSDVYNPISLSLEITAEYAHNAGFVDVPLNDDNQETYDVMISKWTGTKSESFGGTASKI